MNKRDIVFTLKMRNAAKQAISAFANDFKRAAKEAQAAVRDIARVADALDRVGTSSARSGAMMNANVANMKKALASLAAQAKTTQAAINAAYSAQPRTPRQSGQSRPSSGVTGDGVPLDLRRDAADAARQIATGFNQARQSALGLREAIVTVAAILAGGFGAKKILDTADQYTMLRSQLTLVTKSQEELNAVYERTFQIAQTTRQDVDSTINLYARLQKSTKGVGYSAETLLGVTETINKALATTPGPASSAQAALFQLSQGLATGTLRGEELNSVLEQAPRLAQAIADGMNVPVGSLRKLAEQNKLTTEAVIGALISQKNAIDKEFGKINMTAGQGFTVLGNAIVDYVGKADTAVGATNAFAKQIAEATKILRDPSMASGAVRAMELFGAAASGTINTVLTLINHIDLVAAALAALAVRAAFPFFAGLVTGAIELAAGLRALATGAGLAAVGMTGLQLSLGLIGVALAAAAAAFAYFSVGARSSSEASDKLRQSLSRMGEEGRDATDTIKKLTDAQRSRATLDWTMQLKEAEKQLNALARGAGAMLGAFDGSKVKENAPFQSAIDAFNQSVRDGKPDVQAFADEVARIGAENLGTAVGDRAAKLLVFIEKARKADEAAKALRENLRLLEDTKVKLDASGLIDGALALKTFTEKMKELSKIAGPSKAAQEALDDITKATAIFEQAVKSAGDAFKTGEIGIREYQARLAEARKKFEEVKQAATGFTEAMRELHALEKDNAISGMADGRAKRLAEINKQYDELKRKTSESALSEEEKAKVLAGYDAQRAAAIQNLDNAYRNGSFADRIRDLENEAKLIGLVGEERERMVKKLEVEAEARKAGVADIQAYVNAYLAEYDKLKRLQEQDSTFGRGFSNAMKLYIEETKNVAKESEKLWSGVFSKLEDGFVEVVTTGKLNFQNFLQGLAQDFARFASRQLLKSLFQSISGGSDSSSGNWIAAAMTAVGAAISGKGSGSSTTSSTLTTAAGAASKAVGDLANAAIKGTESFGGIPGMIAEALKGLGATDAGIAGFLGNIMRESRFNPNAVNPSSGAYGLAQWFDRKDSLFKFAGTETPSASQQVEFLTKELLTTEKASLELLRKATTLQDGVNAGLRFERPEGYSVSNPFGAHDWDKRYDFAQNFWGSQKPVSMTDMSSYTLSPNLVKSLESQFSDISNSASALAPSLRNLDGGIAQTASSVAQTAPQVATASQAMSAQIAAGGTQAGVAWSSASSQVTAGGATVGAAFQQAAAQVTGSASGGGGFWSWLTGLFGGGTGNTGQTISSGTGGLYHKGGIAGVGSGMTRSISHAAWAGARRYHSGGIAGLRSGETPIIAEEGEAILPTVRLPNGQFGVRALSSGDGGGSSFTMGDININTQGSSGDPAKDGENAKNIGREVREAMQQAMNEWAMKNRRAGGLLYNGGN